MRFYLHSVFQQVYICLGAQLEWISTLPHGLHSSSRCAHLYARQVPDQGQPARECGLVPVYEAMFAAFFKEISPEQAHQIDPKLVEYCVRAREIPALHFLQTFLVPGAQLHLVDCGQTAEGFLLFDVYLVPANSPKWVYLNPALAHLFPTRTLDGARRILVPFSREEVSGGILLTRAISARVWGEREEAPAFAFEIAS